MDFFGSLNELRKNSGQLNAWEQKQRDKDAQRKAYIEKHAPSQAEIESAKELGENLINVIDIMDDHSESVAENVETATAGVSNLATLGGGAAATYFAYKVGQSMNKKIKAERETFDKDTKTKELLEKLNETQEVTKPDGSIVHEHKAKVRQANGALENRYFSTWDLRSDSKWAKDVRENITDAKLREEVIEVHNQYIKKVKPFQNKTKWALMSIPATALLGWLWGNVFTTKLQVDSSKIARFQARRELNDPKAFVNYTPEQIAQAQAEIEKHPEKIKKAKKDHLKKGFFSSMRELLKDKDNYEKTKALRAKKQSIVDRPLSEAEILQAKKDQEVIQRVVKKINNDAEKNSEMMETSANLIMGTFPVVGGAIGWALTLGLEKTGLIKKWVGNYVNKNGSVEAKAAWQEFSAMKTDDPKYMAKWRDFYAKFTDIPTNLKQAEEFVNENKKKSKFADADHIKFLKKAFAGHMANAKTTWIGSKGIIGITASILAAFPSAIIALNLQKDAARAGRFTAKRNLEKDPTNFIGLADTELDEVKDVKNNKKRESKLKEYALFIPRVLKDYYKYKKYQKNDFQKQQALNAELRKLEVTDEQLRDAKNLQNKVFNTFEKVDDKSQTYSETMEAVIETSQPLVYGAGYLLAASPLIYFGVQAVKGKYTPSKLAAKITNFIATSTTLTKSKLFKGYLKGVDKNVAEVIDKVEVPKHSEFRHLTGMFKDVDLLETPVLELATKTFNNARLQFSERFHRMNNDEQMYEIYEYIHKARKAFIKQDASWEKVYDLENKISAKINTGDFTTDMNLEKAVRALTLGSEKDIMLIEPSIRQRAAALFSNSEMELVEAYRKNRVVNEALSTIYNELHKINDPALRANLFDVISMNRPAIEKMSEADFANAKKYLLDKVITPEREEITNQVFSTLRNLQAPIIGRNPEAILKVTIGAKAYSAVEKLPPQVKSTLLSIINKAQEINIPEGTEFIAKLQTATTKDDVVNLLNKMPSLSDVPVNFRLKDIPNFVDDVANIANGMKSAGNLASMINGAEGNSRLVQALGHLGSINNPKGAAEKLVQHLESIDNEAYLDLVKGSPFSSWEKENTIKVVKNFVKMYDNLPKEEMKKIMLTIIKEFNENPDKVAYALKNGNISKIFYTPQLDTAIKAAGITWAAFSFVMTYIIESWLSDIQLRSGRLGVKKAMDELQDHRYYANIIPDEKVEKQTAGKKVAEPAKTTSSDLLNKYKKQG